MELIYIWAERVNMHFNSDKFECLRFWPNSSATPDYNYKGPDSKPIEVKSDLRDLGVQLSSDLTFKLHIKKTVAGVSKLAGWGLRTFRRRSKGVMKTLWKSLVQPKIDYCSQLWSPDDQNSINRLESVQRHFTSKVNGLDNLNYWERLKQLQQYSQERRRERYMIIFLWKISQGLVKGYNVQFTPELGRRGRSIIPKTIVKSAPLSVRRARESSLAVKGAKIFNLLPVSIRNMNTDHIETFKSNLDSFLNQVPDQPTVAGLPRAAQSNSLLHQIPMLGI